MTVLGPNFKRTHGSRVGPWGMHGYRNLRMSVCMYFLAGMGALYLVACGTYGPVHPYGLRRGCLRVVYDV